VAKYGTATQGKHFKLLRNTCIACWLEKTIDRHSEYREYIACWLEKTIDRHSEYREHIAFPRQKYKTMSHYDG
jgi:hypothetical protein